MTSLLAASSLTADISDTNALLDDLLHQLALHSDYAALKQLKHSYSHITRTSATHHAAVKRAVAQLSADVDGLEERLAAPELDEARERRRRAEAEVRDGEATVAALRDEERAVRSEVEEKVDETKRVEEKQHELLQRHHEKMAELKSASHSRAHAHWSRR